MIPARVLGCDPITGKIYQAMRGERDSWRWRWIDVTHEADTPNTRGDVVFTFPGGINTFPMTPPARSTVDANYKDQG
jgi:hypothetical protein